MKVPNNDKVTHAQNTLSMYTNDYKIFMDTCSILYFSSDKFWMNIIPLLREHNNKIIIPLRAIEELEKHSTNKINNELAVKSKSSLKILQQLQSAELIEIKGEKTDNFADNVFQVVFTKFRMTHKLLLITQDKNLASDILSLNKGKAVRANNVHVRQINQYGFLSNFNFLEKENIKTSIQKSKVIDTLDEGEVFKICQTVTEIEDIKLKITHIPNEYETVYTSRGSIELKGKVASGGEGVIYNTNTPYIAKIYKTENNTKRKFEKIKLMLSKPTNCEGICYPIEILYNSKKEFIGYLMPKAKGKELQKSIFIKPLFQKNFPNWKKRDTVELCITILNKIKYLHDRNIIMGDINPANILVVSPKEVYFVDTDSYQVEDFPCPVGTNNYTAPEIQRKHFANFLRTIGNENFAVATLLFMIMLPGKPPYSQQGGEDPIANIIKMDFSYPFGDKSNKKTPDGPWRYIWSHLTFDLKEAFYNTFRKDGEHANEKERLSVNEWLSIFTYYLELLDSGKFGQQDKMSEDIYPTRHKKNSKVSYATCKFCKEEIPEHQCKNGICQDCLNKGEVYRCKKCNKEIMYTNYQRYIKNSKRHDICTECFEYGKQSRLKCACIDCGKIFEITNDQYDFYRSKGFEVPKRCKECIELKKDRTYSSGQNTSYGYSSSSGSFCFITTAVCECLGKGDNCSELKQLRHFRDTWLKEQEGGQALINQYYNEAPLIVSKLKQHNDYELYCRQLFIAYIQPCILLIQDNDYNKCKEKYIEMIEYIRREMQVV